MYIIELISKYIKGKKHKFRSFYAPDNAEDIIEKPQDCKHFFQPLDASNEFFACKFCGLVVNKEKLKHN